MCKVSIIIPVYQAEEHLTGAVDSVLRQTETDLEIILVDDGSDDASPAICDAYAEKDERVKVIHQVNSGVSIARNAGIEAATGKYIGFVDSDDWIDADMFEGLLYEADKTKADMVMCDASTIYSDGKKEADTITQLPHSMTLSHSDMTPERLLELAGSACRCIYSASLLRSFQIRFPQGVKFSEDRIFNLYAMGYANKIAYLKEAYYNRFVNWQSAVHRFHADYFEACKLAADATRKAIETAWNDDESYQTAYLRQFISGAFMAVNNYYYKTSTLTAKEKKEAVIRLCDDEQLRSAIEKYGANRQSRWILDRNYFMLIAYAKLANWKHGR